MITSTYISIKETAEKFGLTPRRVQVLCEKGRIPGATMISGVWLVPSDATKPSDARLSKLNEMPDQLSLFDNPNDDLLSLAELCEHLSVSTATGKNWIKLGKIKPTKTEGKHPLFSKEYLNLLKTELQSSDNSALKRRRNKKHVSGSVVYRDYIEDQSNHVLHLIEEILTHDSEVFTDENIKIIISDYAVQLFLKANNIQLSPNHSYIKGFVNGDIDLGGYGRLVLDLLGSCKLTDDKLDALSFALGKNVELVDGQDLLGMLYISLRNLGVRKAKGAYFTPISVVKTLVNELEVSVGLEGKNIIDPCCGTGNFLLYAKTYVDNPKMLFGQDSDPISIAIARINIALHYRVEDIEFLYVNFRCADTLHELNRKNYDIVIGNPPWGYSFEKEEIALLKNKYLTAKQKGIESYDLFIENALNHLENGGSLSFVLPEAILNVKSHTAIRQLIIDQACIQSISYLGNAFNGVQCPSIILSLKKDTTKFSTVGTSIALKDTSFTINIERQLSSEYFNLNFTDEEFNCLDKISNHPNKKFLKDNADFALGIVTGNNNKFIVNENGGKNEVILKGNNLLKYEILPSDNYLEFVPSAFQQVAPTEFYRAPEKLLYRFVCNSLVFAYDDKQTLTLNSCNIMIPRIEGLSMKYVLAVLNSRAAEFFCDKKFNSVKILRSHIEEIPIPFIDDEKQKVIIDLVNQIITENNPTKKQDIYEVIDQKIMDLFGLTNEERAIIHSSLDKKNIFLTK